MVFRDRPKIWQDKAALRTALNINPVMSLMPCVWKTEQPTMRERWWLFALYMITGLFIEHLSLLYGPICREAYEKQCGLDAYDKGEPLFPDQVGKAVGRSFGGGGIDLVKQGATKVTDEINGSRNTIIGMLSGHIPELNCKMTKCDHWEQAHIQLRTGEDSQYVSFLMYPGLCRCTHTVGQKITFRLAAALCSVIFQIAMYKTFHKLLSTDWETRGTFCVAIHRCVMVVLTIVLVGESIAIFLVRFMPDAWIVSLAVSLATVMTVSFATQFILAHIGVARIPPEFNEEPGKVAPSNDPGLINAALDDGRPLLSGVTTDPPVSA